MSIRMITMGLSFAPAAGAAMAREPVRLAITLLGMPDPARLIYEAE